MEKTKPNELEKRQRERNAYQSGVQDGVEAAMLVVACLCAAFIFFT